MKISSKRLLQLICCGVLAMMFFPAIFLGNSHSAFAGSAKKKGDVEAKGSVSYTPIRIGPDSRLLSHMSRKKIAEYIRLHSKKNPTFSAGPGASIKLVVVLSKSVPSIELKGVHVHLLYTVTTHASTPSHDSHDSAGDKVFDTRVRDITFPPGSVGYQTVTLKVKQNPTRPGQPLTVTVQGYYYDNDNTDAVIEVPPMP